MIAAYYFLVLQWVYNYKSEHDKQPRELTEIWWYMLEIITNLYWPSHIFSNRIDIFYLDFDVPHCIAQSQRQTKASSPNPNGLFLS